MYLMNCTRLGIAYVVSKLSRYTSNPSDDHWTALLRVLGYVSHTKECALRYEQYPPVLEGYIDANWIADSEESKSTSGYVFTLGCAAVSWKSFQQTCITRSTIESEFIVLDKAGEETDWLWQFLKDIPLWPKPGPPYAFIAIIKQRYLGHKILYITVSLDIFVVDIIPLSSYSLMKLSLLTLYR